MQDDFAEYQEDISTSDLSFEMVPVSGGKFTMGSSLDDENRGADNGLPILWKCQISGLVSMTYLGSLRVMDAQH